VGLLAFIGVLQAPVFVDEADNVMGACLISRGEVLYRDFFSHHFPLPYYALGVLGGPAACSVLAGRVLGIVGLTAAAALFAWTARNPFAPLGLVLLGLTAPLYYLQLYLAETYQAVGLIAVLGLLTDQGRRMRGPLAHALRFIALAILASSSPLGLMMAALLLPLVVLGSGRPYTPSIAAGAAALLVWPAVLAVQGTLPAFVQQGILFNTQVYGSYLPVQLTNPLALLWETLTFFRHRFSFVMDWLIGQDTKATAESFASIFELLLATVFVALVLVRRQETLFRLGALLMLPLAVARDGFHLSPFVVVAAFGCAQLLPPLALRSGRFQLVALAIGLVALRIYFFFLPLEPGQPSELAESMRPEAQVARHTDPDDTVLYLPIAPQAYLADDRRPGSFYTSFLPWVADVPGAEDRLISDVERNKVKLIVLDQDAQVWDQYRLDQYAPRLVAYIRANYQPLDSGDRRHARFFLRPAS
jgi:hypothetical protein